MNGALSDSPETFTKSSKPCINCGTDIHGKYCHECGQPRVVQRLNIVRLAQDFQEKYFGLDGRFGRTCKAIILDPGKLSKTFIAGNRRKYIGPIGMFFIFLTVYLLTLQLLGLDISDVTLQGTKISLSDDRPEDAEKVTQAFVKQFSYYYKIFSFSSVVIAGFILWMFNRYMKFNVIEHMIFAFYVYSVQYLMNIIQIPFIQTQYFVHSTIAMSLLTNLFFVYAYCTYDLRAGLFKRILKALVVLILSIFLTAMIVAILAIFFVLKNKGLSELP